MLFLLRKGCKRKNNYALPRFSAVLQPQPRRAVGPEDARLAHVAPQDLDRAVPGRPGDVPLLDAFPSRLGDVAGPERVTRQLGRIEARASRRSLHDPGDGVTAQATVAPTLRRPPRERDCLRGRPAGSPGSPSWAMVARRTCPRCSYHRCRRAPPRPDPRGRGFGVPRPGALP